ncbi:flagellar hook-length control protein FliK [Nitratireductor sp. CH_MIT9313-5]|uniref:flagellar hook-length control protein FliK n=1 Tax=Nitratireductor sp. CH_MIT9313-5 TaxID=3107764 RepID=UPI00300979B2
MNSLMSTLLGNLPSRSAKPAIAQDADGKSARQLFQDALKLKSDDDAAAIPVDLAPAKGADIVGESGDAGVSTRLSDILDRLAAKIEAGPLSGHGPEGQKDVMTPDLKPETPEGAAEGAEEPAQGLQSAPAAAPAEHALQTKTIRGKDNATGDPMPDPADAADEQAPRTFAASAPGEVSKSEIVREGEKQATTQAQPAPRETATATAKQGAAVAEKPSVAQTADASARNDSGEMGGGKRDEQAARPFKTVSVSTSPQPVMGNFASHSALGDQVTSALSSDKAFQAAASAAPREIFKANSSAPDVLHTIKIQLRPAELGNVTAVLRGSGDQLSVELQVETEAARNKLSADGDSIAKALRSLGYEVDRITIQQTSASGSTNAQHSSTHGRGQGFENASPDGRSGSGNQGNSHTGSDGSGQRSSSAQGPQNAATDTDSIYI